MAANINKDIDIIVKTHIVAVSALDILDLSYVRRVCVRPQKNQTKLSLFDLHRAACGVGHKKCMASGAASGHWTSAKKLSGVRAQRMLLKE